VLLEILQAAPTAELEPLIEGRVVQTDEQDMGLSSGVLTYIQSFTWEEFSCFLLVDMFF
jgi:NH3-dependent NAD+ synthetase